MKRLINISFILLIAVLSSCTCIRQIPEGKTLYNKAKFELATPKKFNKSNQVKEALEERARPQPNRKFLGLFRIRLWLHLKVKEPKKERGFRHWLKNKIGEPPVYGSEGVYRQSSLLMRQYLHNNGYFISDVRFETRLKKRQEIVTYTATTEGQYRVLRVYLPEDTSALSTLMRAHEKELAIKPGEPYSTDKLSAEREKFAVFIRSEGYFDFSREFLYYYVDTTPGYRLLDIYFRVQSPTDTTLHSKYFISDITVFPLYAIDELPGKARNDTLIEKGYTIIQPELFLKRKTLERNILIQRGEPFSQKLHGFTVNHFLDLGIFKFVNIRYEKSAPDSLDALIQLTPSNTQDITGEFNVSTTTTNFLGLGASASYINRNLFKGAEQLTITGSVNAETQLNAQQSFINTLEIMGQVELGFPHLLVPFGSKKVSQYFVPRTKLALLNNFQKRIEFFSINALSFDYAYDWRTKATTRHIVTPLSITDIRLLNTTSEFTDILARNPALRLSFDDVFIIGMKYSFIYTGSLRQGKRNYGYFRSNIELAGNIIYPIANAFDSETQRHELFGRPFANYSRFDLDGRYYLKMTKKHSFVNRVLAGIAIPYGNSEVTPYIKQFFMGGANSVRAYRLRMLGPGGFTNPDPESRQIFPDQTGDIRLELNSEYRFTIVKFLKGALFADAGNVWLLRPAEQRPDGEFEFSRFYKEIAIGTGVGVRLDFNFFVIRTDVSFPLRKPELPAGDRWTFDKLYFKDKNWRRDNLIWNIAIGYPF